MTCAHAVSEGFKKVEGVESAEIGLTRGHGTAKLKAGNRAGVEDFWKVVWGNGNKPKETRVVANGEVMERSGRWYFQMTPDGAEYPIEGQRPPAGRVEVTGVLQPPKDKKSVVPLQVESWKPM